MEKHDCHIDTKSPIAEGPGYICHRIIANHEDGFRKHWHNSPDPETTDYLGDFYETTEDDENQSTRWTWRLEPFEHNGRTRQNRKPFDSKSDAIASLSKALDRRGYRLVAGD